MNRLIHILLFTFCFFSLAVAQNSISAYTWWLDDDYSNSTTAAENGMSGFNFLETIEASSLSEGVHFFNFRLNIAIISYLFIND